MSSECEGDRVTAFKSSAYRERLSWENTIMKICKWNTNSFPFLVLSVFNDGENKGEDKYCHLIYSSTFSYLVSYFFVTSDCNMRFIFYCIYYHTFHSYIMSNANMRGIFLCHWNCCHEFQGCWNFFFFFFILLILISRWKRAPISSQRGNASNWKSNDVSWKELGELVERKI